MKKILVIGSNSDIAKSAISLLTNNYEIVTVPRARVDLTERDAEQQLNGLLKIHQPDIIINCAGVFGDNNADFDTTFRVNVQSNWSVIKYYIDNPSDEPIKFIMIGSEVYRHPRRNIMLYAASKAALYSIWRSASELPDFSLVLGLINPIRVNTKMVENWPTNNPNASLEAVDVANEIVKMVDNMTTHMCLDLDKKVIDNLNTVHV